MSGLVLGIRTEPNKFTRLKLEEVNFDTKIGCFKTDISTKINVPKDSLELVYCGNILDDDQTLGSSGLRPGVMLHVLKKRAKEMPIPSQPMSEQDIKALVIAFRTLALNPSHRSALQKLSRPDILENIIQITPGLSQDPVAISLIQDPELMVRLANFDTVRRIVELHPALAEAANHIAATVHEEALHNHTAGPSTSSGYSLLDLISDDDDMESSQILIRYMNLARIASRLRAERERRNVNIGNSSDDDDDGDGDGDNYDYDLGDDESFTSQSSDSVQPSVSRQSSFSVTPITPAQLAAALASASQSGGGNRSTSDASGSTITPEMVSEAMQRAMASVAPAAGLASTPTDEGNNEGSSNFREQMRQMRELGLTDDVVNFQALQLAGGNVHAAVDLVFSGAISPDTAM